MNSPTPISLKAFNTFGIEVHCHELYTVSTKAELKALFLAGLFKRNPKIISGGSNLLLTQDILVPVILNRIKGIRVSGETDERLSINFGAGESWHESVMYAVNKNWGGMENLSLIPGCMGAAPIQNIGAYGVELKDIFEYLEAFNLQTGEFEIFHSQDCHFGYRDSIFKNEKKNHYFITDVCLTLDKTPVIRTQYGDIQAVLDSQNLSEITIADVSKAVIQIRQSKLPDPAEIGNSGSFFKNPVIPNKQAEALQKQFPSVKCFPQNDHETKIPAAWLIENSGWKGHRRGDIGVHTKQALVLVNYGNGKGSDVHQLARDIQEDVRQKFNITLDFEVNIW